jgi:hypothetical protein
MAARVRLLLSLSPIAGACDELVTRNPTLIP